MCGQYELNIRYIVWPVHICHNTLTAILRSIALCHLETGLAQTPHLMLMRFLNIPWRCLRDGTDKVIKYLRLLTSFKLAVICKKPSFLSTYPGLSTWHVSRLIRMAE